MDEQNFNNTVDSANDNFQNAVDNVTDRVNQEGSQIRDKVSRTATQVKDKASELSSQVKEKAGQSVDKVSVYFKERDSQEMLDDLQGVVRRYPGKSLLVGLVLGVLVGRIFR